MLSQLILKPLLKQYVEEKIYYITERILKSSNFLLLSIKYHDFELESGKDHLAN